MQAVGALERGDRRSPQRETLVLLIEALRLDPEQRGMFEAAAVRQSPTRPDRAPVTPGPWPAGPIAMLPLPLSSYVGNAVQIRELADLIREHRVVTLTGPGGIGKTRMALEVAAKLLETSEFRVRLVELAPIGNAELVVAAIAAALGLQHVPDHALLETLQAHLQREAMILLLDNCEHVIVEAANVAEKLLRACSLLRIVATSREPLRVAGERVYRMAPLASPAADNARGLDAQAAIAYPAVELFVQRARAADHRFAITDQTAAAIGAVCTQLDGIPLAIELAAARATTIPVAMMAERLERRFALLSRGERTAHARHRTMWAAIEWSYELLSPPERSLFERLSIFVGRSTVDAVRDVCAGDGIAEGEVGELLDALVEKSLVVADVAGHEPHYAMLESFREFAREKLVVRELAENLARKHALVYLARMERLFGALERESEMRIIAAVRVDLENWRAAIAWALGPTGDPEIGQRLIVPIAWWLAPPEAMRWMDLARAHVGEHTSNELIVRMTYIDAGLAAATSGDLMPALENAEEALAYFDAVNDDLWGPRAALRRARYLLYTFRFAEAEIALHQAIEHGRAVRSPRTVALARVSIGRLHSMRREFDAARNACEDALVLFENLDSLEGRCQVFEILADVEMRSNNPAEALGFYLQELDCARERNDGLTLGVTLTNLTWCLIANDRFDDAQTYAHEALDYSTRYDMKANTLYLLEHLVAIHVLRPGSRDASRAALRAARVIGFVDARRRTIANIAREPSETGQYERILRALEAHLDASECEAAMAVGAAMTQDEAIAEAVGAGASESFRKIYEVERR